MTYNYRVDFEPYYSVLMLTLTCHKTNLTSTLFYRLNLP